MKLSKREFVKGAGSVALVAAGTVAWGADLPRLRQPTFDVIVYNNWYPQACAFASTFDTQAIRALAVQGDAGALWYRALRTLVEAGARRIAGMTTHTDFLILETLARDKGLHPSHHDNAGRLVSWILT